MGKNKKVILSAVIILLIALGAWWFLAGEGSKEETVACTMEAKICPDGSSVGRIPPQCNFAPCPKEELIQVEVPQANEAISSPLVIKGKVRGSWFFEGVFPVKLYDGNGQLLAVTTAQATKDLLSEDFVPFEAELKFLPPETEKGTLALEKDNLSGLAENADELRIPVFFAKETGESQKERKVKLYYYKPELDQDKEGNLACSRKGLVAVERTIPLTETPIQDTIRLLIGGELTGEEKAEGIKTEYPLEGLSLEGATLKDGVLTLHFSDPEGKTSGGSCRAGILWFQIEETAKQFPEVKEVRFLPEDLFQP
ncbi:GerMN domain-containing protein [Candidatus Shapirobacteria bacterium]|nr:GerMN domain-containing protein [Candidatus Shapirobacteria bacterium]